MNVDCKTVAGRRQLEFASFDEMLADAEKLVASPDTKMLGNWSLNQLLSHLAMAMNMSIDGISMKGPWYIRLIGPLLKRRVLRDGMPSGFKLPKDREAGAFPSADSPQAALEALRKSVARTRREPMTAAHPVFGKLSHDEWARFHLRHAELHLSFAAPGTSGNAAGNSKPDTARVAP